MMSVTSKSGSRWPPIAIIGMSGRYARADTLEAFHENLCHGVDCVGPLSKDRKIYSAVPEGRHIETGHLDRVDLFDHAFFGLSKGEAEHIDPQHRIVLEVACLAIQNAGYSLHSFRGGRTAVILAAPLSSYYAAYLYPKTTAASVFGNAQAMATARLNYLLDLRGPSMMIDTTCSSSLATVYEACNKLWLEEVDVAIAGGVNIKSRFDDEAGGWGQEVIARNGRSKTFDASADGTGVGEGAGVVVLKPLARALADRDNVHAVILGVAANNDGDRSNGMTSPSAEAQAEVLTRAWRSAGVAADSIGFIEVHGTGTRVGDPIETRGLTAAFASATDKVGFCAISSVKSNIGHTGYAAGAASLLKAVLSLKSRRLYPTVHFHELNPLIELEGSAVYVNTELRDWEEGPAPRRAGVSAFGMSGTNVHLVLEEAPRRSADQPTAMTSPCLVATSARSEALLERYLRSLAPAIERSADDARDIAFVLNAGRDHYPCREAFVVRDRDELVTALSDRLSRGVAAVPATPRDVAFLLTGDVAVADDALGSMRRLHPAFDEAIGECLSSDHRQERGSTSEPARVFAALYGAVRTLEALGVRARRFFGCGVGNFVLSALRGKLGLAAALEQAASWRPPADGFNREELRRALDGIPESTPPIFVALAPGSAFAQEVARHPGQFRVESAEASGAAELFELLASLYRAGVDIDWEAHYRGAGRRRVELPPIPFERTRCWIVPPSRADSPAAALGAQPKAASSSPPTGGPIAEVRFEGAGISDGERKLGLLWAQILKVDALARDTEFADVGGDSLSALDIAERVQQVFDVSLRAQDFVDYSSLSKLAGRIEHLRQHARDGTS